MIFPCLRQFPYRGKLFKKSFIIRTYCFYSRLLEHDLRNPHSVWRRVIPPREHPRIFSEPLKKRSNDLIQFIFHLFLYGKICRSEYPPADFSQQCRFFQLLSGRAGTDAAVQALVRQAPMQPCRHWSSRQALMRPCRHYQPCRSRTCQQAVIRCLRSFCPGHMAKRPVSIIQKSFVRKQVCTQLFV